jgi:ketosteroid isomerase-like protein
MLQEADTCVLEARVSGTHTGPLASPAGEIAPTGKPFALDYVNVARFADGLIVSETYYSDNQAFLTQLGLV